MTRQREKDKIYSKQHFEYLKMIYADMDSNHPVHMVELTPRTWRGKADYLISWTKLDGSLFSRVEKGQKITNKISKLESRGFTVKVARWKG